MVEIVVDMSELKDGENDAAKKVAGYLGEKTGLEATVDSKKVKVKGDLVSRKYLRTLLKKYLHKQKLKDLYRVISEDENVLKLKRRKTHEE
jgi:hypothetical protein